MEASLIKRLKDAIGDVYHKYTALPDETIVDVSQDGVFIYFNSEQPYLGMGFFELIDEAKRALDDILNPEGYIYDRSDVMFDFIVWHYDKLNDNENDDG